MQLSIHQHHVWVYYEMDKYAAVIDNLNKIKHLDCKELICELIKKKDIDVEKLVNKIGCPKCRTIVHNIELRCPECYCELDNYSESEM